MDQEKSTQSGSATEPGHGSSFQKIMGTASDFLPSGLPRVIRGGSDSNSNALTLETPPKSPGPSIDDSTTDDDTVEHSRSQVASFIASVYTGSGEGGAVQTTDLDASDEEASGYIATGQEHRSGTTGGLSSKLETVKEKVSSAVHALSEEKSSDDEDSTSAESKGLSEKFQDVKEKVSSAVHALGEKQSSDDDESKSAESKGLSGKFEDVKEKVTSAVQSAFGKKPSSSGKSDSEQITSSDSSFVDVEIPSGSLVFQGQEEHGKTDTVSDDATSASQSSPSRFETFKQMLTFDKSDKTETTDPDDETKASSVADDEKESPKLSRLERFKQLLSFDKDEEKASSGEETETPKSASTLDRIKQFVSFESSGKDPEAEGTKTTPEVESTDVTKPTSTSPLQKIKNALSFDQSSDSQEVPKSKPDEEMDAADSKPGSDKDVKSPFERLRDKLNSFDISGGSRTSTEESNSQARPADREVASDDETKETSTSTLQKPKEVLSVVQTSYLEKDPKAELDDADSKSPFQRLKDKFESPLSLRTPPEEDDKKSGDREAEPDEEVEKKNTSPLQKIKAALSFDTSSEAGKEHKAEVGEEGSEGSGKVDDETGPKSPWEKFKDRLSFDAPSLALRTNPEEDSDAGDKEVESGEKAEKGNASPLQKVKEALSFDSSAASAEDSKAKPEDVEGNKENREEVTDTGSNTDAKKPKASSKDVKTSEDEQQSKSPMDKVKEFFSLDKKEEEKKASAEKDSEKGIEAKTVTVAPDRARPKLDLRHRSVKTELEDDEPEVRVVDVHTGDMASPQCTDGVKSLFTNSHFERPDNAVLATNKEADYEIREYPKTKWASVQVKTLSHKDALEHGFKALHEYIQGYNEHKEKLRMTVPVLTHVEPSVGPDGRFTVSFFTSHELEVSPEPASFDVYRSEKPGMKVFVRTFGGFAEDKDWVIESSKLANALEAQGQNFIKDSYYIAEYDHPWKVFGRTNEVWFVQETF